MDQLDITSSFFIHIFTGLVFRESKDSPRKTGFRHFDLARIESSLRFLSVYI